MKEHPALTLGIIGLITAVILDLIGIVALLVLSPNRGSAFALWAIAGIVGLIAGAIIGAFSSSRHLVTTAGGSSLLAAALLGLALWITLDLTDIGPQLGRLYLWATAFQIAGSVVGAVAGHFGRPSVSAVLPAGAGEANSESENRSSTEE
jgi:hypothetical protein